MISEALSDEVQVINAIYGEETVQIIKTISDVTRVRLTVPISEEARGRKSTTLRSLLSTIPGAAFWIDFPALYRAAPPIILEADVPLQDYRTKSVWKTHLVLYSTLQAVFTPGDVCVFDWIEVALPLLDCLTNDGLDTTEARNLLPLFDFEDRAWRWAFAESLRVSSFFEIVPCTICLDECSAFRMVKAPCNHFLCVDCFHAGWDVATKVNQPYTCCLLRIPVNVIRDFARADEESLRRYTHMLAERDTPNPIFCGYSPCGQLIGSLDTLKPSAGSAGPSKYVCHCCKEQTCSACGAYGHGRWCEPDLDLTSYLETADVRRCEKCGQGIMKNGGCSHMTCVTCGTIHSWESEADMVTYDRIHRSWKDPGSVEELA